MLRATARLVVAEAGRLNLTSLTTAANLAAALDTVIAAVFLMIRSFATVARRATEFDTDAEINRLKFTNRTMVADLAAARETVATAVRIALYVRADRKSVV